MTLSPGRRGAALVVVLALAATTPLTSGLSASASSAPDGEVSLVAAPEWESGDGLETSAEEAPTSDAEVAVDALAEVREFFTADTTAGPGARSVQPTDDHGDHGDEASHRDATLALRDLARHADALPAEEQAEARAYLSRPTSGSGDEVAGFTVKYDVPSTRTCNADLCIHYVTSTADAPSLADSKNAAGKAGANGVPDYVDQVLRVMDSVHDRYLKAGYREPRPDNGRGGDDRIDIYLAEIGTAGLYGYCTTDQGNPPQGSPQFYDRWAYCTLDNDYAGFPGTPLQSLQVTAAHEYFHATQFAYDFFEDGWFLESTATWAEDELYDKVNDNAQYFGRSPLTAPFVPLDAFVSNGDFNGFHYGTWTFIRFLTEKYRGQKGGLPRFVLDLMKKVDGSRGAKDLYSWQAVDAVLKTKKSSAAKQFLAYSVGNRRPRATYDEGKAQKYPTGPLAGRATLTPRRSRVKPSTIRMDHLTSATFRLTPKKLQRKSTRLRVALDMAPRKNGSLAAVTVVPKKGKVRTSTIKLSKKGNGAKAVPFSSRRVKYVEVTLANSSARFTSCFQQYTPFSCLGIPRDDNKKQQISARVLR